MHLTHCNIQGLKQLSPWGVCATSKSEVLYIIHLRMHMVLKSLLCVTNKPLDQVTHGTYSYHSNPSGTGDSSSTRTDLWGDHGWWRSHSTKLSWVARLSHSSTSASPSREPAQQKCVYFFPKMLLRARSLYILFTTWKKDTKENPATQTPANNCRYFYTSNKRLVPTMRARWHCFCVANTFPHQLPLSSLPNHQPVMAPWRGRDLDPS